MRKISFFLKYFSKTDAFTFSISDGKSCAYITLDLSDSWQTENSKNLVTFDKNICNLQQYYVIWLQATAFWYRKSDHPAVYHLKGTVSRDFRHSLWKTLRGTKQKRFFFLFRRFPRKTCVYVVVDYADTVSNSNILKSWKWGVTVQANFLNFVIEYLCENEKVR